MKNNEKDLEKIKKWLMKLIPEHYDVYDFRAKYDSTLTLEENKNIMLGELKVLVKDLKEEYKEAKSEQERITQEAINSAEEEVRIYNKSLSYDESEASEQLEVIYTPIRRGVAKMVQGFSNLLFIRGRGGIGKSYQIRKYLNILKGDFIEVAGDCTDAYLYRLIYENNGKIIWFKDSVKIIQNQTSINLLKAATETEECRILTKSNYSKQQDDLPNQFICKCKFIFDYNNVLGNGISADFEALTTRGDFVELLISDDDVKMIMRLIAKEKWQKEVTELIIKEFEKNDMIRMNLRTQCKAFKTYQYALQNSLNWQMQITGELGRMSKTVSMLYTLIGTKAIRTTDLKKKMLKNEVVHCMRTADRKIKEWLEIEDIYRYSPEERNFYVGIIKPKQIEV